MLQSVTECYMVLQSDLGYSYLVLGTGSAAKFEKVPSLLNKRIVFISQSEKNKVSFFRPIRKQQKHIDFIFHRSNWLVLGVVNDVKREVGKRYYEYGSKIDDDIWGSSSFCSRVSS